MKKLLLPLFTFLLLFFTCISSVHAQSYWAVRDTLPDSAMFQGLPGFAIGNYGYAGLGDTYYAGNPSPDLWQFDPSNNSWAKKADFPGSARVAPACFVIGDKAYIVTGSVVNAGTCVKECWQYDGTADTWTKEADFPGGARTYAVGFAINGMGYVGTGANELSDFYKDFYKYNPDSNTWTRIADFPAIARDADCGFAINGKGYVCLGKDSTGALYKDLWQYDPGTNTWTRKADYPYCPTQQGANGFVICNNFYVCGGDSSDGVSLYPETWRYNTTTDTWAQMASVPGPSKIEGASFAIGDTGYFGFGVDTTLLARNIFHEFYAGDSCNLTAGIHNINLAPSISLYPNPANQQLHIQFNGHITGPATLSVMCITGRKVLTSQCSSIHSVFNMDVSSLPPGMYFLSVQSGNINLIRKFVKQ